MKRICKHVIIIVGLVCFFILTGCTDSSVGQFEPLYQDYQQIISKPGIHYTSSIAKIGALKIQLRSFLNNNASSKKRPEAERILQELNNLQITLQQEQFEYTELEKQLKQTSNPYSTDILIADIKNFIRKYPRTIKLNALEKKIDTLYYRKFQDQTNKPLHTITELNQGIQVGMDYLTQIRDKNLLTKIKDKVKQLEKDRQRVYNNEFQLKANQLLSQMKQQVIELARRSHRFSKVENFQEKVISGDLSTPALQMTLAREYSIQMRGAIVGLTRFQLIIQTKGIIDGTFQGGVSYKITEITKVSDYLIK